MDRIGENQESQGKALEFRHAVSNAYEVMDLLNDRNYLLSLAGHFHSRQSFQFTDKKHSVRFEQAAAVVGPARAGNRILLSGVTLYKVTNGIVDEGRFIPLD